MTKRTILAPEASLKYQKVHVQDTPIEKIGFIRRPELRGKFVTLSDQIAETDHFIMNYKYPKCWECFPDHPLMQMVSKYYPNTPKGPLLVDEPKTERQMMVAYEKQKVLKKKGFRHIVIEKDATLEMLLEQLGEL